MNYREDIQSSRDSYEYLDHIQHSIPREYCMSRCIGACPSETPLLLGKVREPGRRLAQSRESQDPAGKGMILAGQRPEVSVWTSPRTGSLSQCLTGRPFRVRPRLRAVSTPRHREGCARPSSLTGALRDHFAFCDAAILVRWQCAAPHRTAVGSRPDRDLRRVNLELGCAGSEASIDFFSRTRHTQFKPVSQARQGPGPPGAFSFQGVQ
jgi:hypothetical protein